MSKNSCQGPVIIGLLLLSLISVACGAQGSHATASPPDVLDEAAAQATAIVRQAQATALVLQAQAQATAVMAQAINFNPSPTPAPTLVMPVPAADQPSASPIPTALSEAKPAETAPQTVEVLRVGFAGEGGMIHILFRAHPKEAEKWWQGSVSVTDETSGAIYNEIPVMPKIGPLIGRPKREGQLGYVMLTNTPPYLQPGAVVTVKLGNYTFEHVQVQ
jgi:hypothetical protein